MAAPRSTRTPSPRSDATPTKRIAKRTKVLTTEMADDAPAATKSSIKTKPVKSKPVKTKTAKAKSVRKKPAKIADDVAAEAVDDSPEAEPATDSEFLEPRDPRPPRRSAVERLDDPPPAAGPVLIARVANAIERELTQIEIIVGKSHVPPRDRTAAERRARTLASLARTLAVVTQLREKNLRSVADDADDDDAMPRDLDEFRETLARRLERLLADHAQSADGEPDME